MKIADDETKIAMENVYGVSVRTVVLNFFIRITNRKMDYCVEGRRGRGGIFEIKNVYFLSGTSKIFAIFIEKFNVGRV